MKFEKNNVEKTGGCISLSEHYSKLSLSCCKPVKILSSVFLDLAIDLNLPIVPIKLAGGLPEKEMDVPLDFPVDYCKQDYYIGKPVLPEELVKLPYAERRKTVLQAINDLGPSYKTETPNAPDHEFRKDVQSWIHEKGVSEVQAVLFKVLERVQEKADDTKLFVKRAYGEKVNFGTDEKGLWFNDLADWLFSI